MFQVGRYDPRADEQRRKKEANTKRKTGTREASQKKKRKNSSNHRKNLDVDESSNHEEQDTAKEACPLKELVDDPTSPNINPKKENVSEQPILQEIDTGGETDSSSSVPSSSGSESEEEDEEEDDNRSRPAAKFKHVIAPEQKPISSLAQRKFGMTDEELDDFDVDDELVAEQNKLHSGGKGKSDEISTALQMCNLSIKEAAAAWGLAPFLVENLERDGYDRFFPIQSLVIPDVIASERHAHIRARDICVAAPTGSGKTLAFVLPVLNALANRKIRRLRALVVLPSRDLASQVFKVFQRYTDGSDLRVGLAIGQSDFKAEQEALTVGPSHLSKSSNMDVTRQRYNFNCRDIALGLKAFPGVEDFEAPSLNEMFSTSKAGRSAVDVLVATPGRLVDHLDKTPGFTLQHLRFLVIDEADRLVNQSYHNWIGRVVSAANEASVSAWNDIQHEQGRDLNRNIAVPLKTACDANSCIIDPITWRRGGSGGDHSEFNTNNAFSSVVATVCRPVQLRKLLYSATLTRDPQKLAALGLVNAKHFDAHHLNTTSHAESRKQRYSMPPGLSEYTVECTAEQKPLVLLALLLDHMSKQLPDNPESNAIVVVFTSSLDSTHRLARLLQLLWSALGHGSPESVAEFSSALNQKQRSKLMQHCNDPESGISIVVCSDGMSRGMDIPSVSAVINYDVPGFAKTYVHRCGRTARAGRKGVAISVLKGGQVTQFFRIRRLIDESDKVGKMGIKKDLVRNAVPAYRDCVNALRRVIEAETDGELSTLDIIPSEWIPRV